MATEDLQGTYSGENVVQAVEGTTPTYNYEDPYGARTQIEQRLGLGEATTAEQEAQAGLLNFQDTTRAQINALRANRDLSTGLEAGFESQRTREASQQEQVLSNQLALAQQKRLALESKVGQEYSVYQSERQNREQALLNALEYGADVNIGMSLEDITKAGVKAKEAYLKKEQKKEEEKAKEAAKSAYKQSLKDQLLAMGSSVKGLSTNELEKKLKKKNKQALEEAKRIAKLEESMAIAKFNKSMSESEESGDDDKEIQNFYSEADALRKEMASGNTNWAYAWSRLRQKYPKASVEAIDNTLGLDYRNKYDN